MSTMKKTETPPAIPIPAEIMAELEEAVADAMAGIRRPEKMDEAARELDEGREEIRRRLGTLDLAVELTDPDGDE
jgi:hypothetical protein